MKNKIVIILTGLGSTLRNVTVFCGKIFHKLGSEEMS